VDAPTQPDLGEELPGARDHRRRRGWRARAWSASQSGDQGPSEGCQHNPTALKAKTRVMDQHPTALERAFELARSGRVKDISEIRAVLKRERYDVDQLQGRQLTMQLQKLINDAKTPSLKTGP
jgi:hypothetical protein